VTRIANVIKLKQRSNQVEDILDSYAIQQGWDEESKIIHLVGYLEFCVERQCAPDADDFTAYLARVQHGANQTMSKGKDIIQRSLMMHPTLFIESLQTQAKTHREYAATCFVDGAKRGARAQERACERIIEWAQRQDLNPEEQALAIVSDGCGPFVVALNAACKLQCIPPHERTAAAVEYDEEHKS
jgi:hypothetical protein